jgi:hypothetical protein
MFLKIKIGARKITGELRIATTITAGLPAEAHKSEGW